MTRYRENIRYSTNGLWVKKEGETYKLGLSAKGQDDVGEVMFAQFNPLEKKIEKNDVIVGVEGAKSVTDLTSPLSGRITAAHFAVEDEPELLNSEYASDNWLLELADVDENDFLEIPEDMEAIEGEK